MAKLIVNNTEKLIGEVTVKSAKNAVLPLIAASILTEDTVILKNCPNIEDVNNMLEIVRCFNGKCAFENGIISIDNSDIIDNVIPCDLAEKLRSSIFMLGPLLSRFKRATIFSPGGCKIGKRPIDIHISCLEQLNVTVEKYDDCIFCNAENAKSGNVFLQYPSVGATENTIMASVFLEGETYIYNAAKELEVVDLCRMLKLFGAKIDGEGGAVIRVIGVKKLGGGVYTPVFDRIAAGTFITAALMNKSDIVISNVNERAIMEMFQNVFKIYCNYEVVDDKIYIKTQKVNLRSFIETNPAPAFPTDMQPLIMTLASVTSGRRVIVENVFENRFGHAEQLGKLGADIEIIGKCAIVNGVKSLKGNTVDALDLRAGASMVLAGMFACGQTIVENSDFIDRGYEDIVSAFKSLGADIKRIL